MALTPEEARVLAVLVEKETTVPDSYPLTLNALRLGCNQTSNRFPVLAYEDRTVDNALVSLKSIGLVRFLHPAHGGRTIRYRHVADERWHLDRNELAVLSVLVLRGPQTPGEISTRAERQFEPGGPSVEEALDTLAARSPEPFAVQLERRAGERERRWAHLLCGAPDDALPERSPEPGATPAREAAAAHPGEPDRLTELEADVSALRSRLARLETLLGVQLD